MKSKEYKTMRAADRYYMSIANNIDKTQALSIWREESEAKCDALPYSKHTGAQFLHLIKDLPNINAKLNAKYKAAVCEAYAKTCPGGIAFVQLTGVFMKELKEKFGITIEGYASPFDKKTEKFCSLYPNVDAPYGSIGNFDTVDPALLDNETVFVNPPRNGLIYTKAINRCLELLDSQYNIRIVFLCPYWPDLPDIDKLVVNNKYLVHKEKIPEDRKIFFFMGTQCNLGKNESYYIICMRNKRSV